MADAAFTKTREYLTAAAGAAAHEGGLGEANAVLTELLALLRRLDTQAAALAKPAP